MSPWGNMLIQTRRAYGTAAHRNRGRYSGSAVHALVIDEICGIVDESIEARAGTFEAAFRKKRAPVTFSTYPICGTTQGQSAGQEMIGLTAANVTCKKCLARMAAQS